MRKILALTNQTATQRNELLLESFLFWAGKHTDTLTQYQIVLIHKPIKTWFLNEYEKLENEFLQFTERHSNATAKDNDRLYARMVGKIYEHYPKVFLDDVKKKYKEIHANCLN